VPKSGEAFTIESQVMQLYKDVIEPSGFLEGFEEWVNHGDGARYKGGTLEWLNAVQEWCKDRDLPITKPLLFNTIVHDGVEYATGSAGSLHLSCPNCGRDRFRHALNYFSHPADWERCFDCGRVMEPVKMSEIESKWKPLWNKIDSRNEHCVVKHEILGKCT